MGLLTPTAGSVLVDGRRISPENSAAWQRNIGYVPQHIYLSDQSISQNIALGVPSAEIDVELVIRSARIASLHEFIIEELPDGYDTIVGERGLRLSGGQRQRIGIARALYHSPSVLVLDEATSALDGSTERAVMKGILALPEEVTTIIIAHRTSTLKGCDVIWVLENGGVAESGTYSELAASGHLH